MSIFQPSPAFLLKKPFLSSEEMKTPIPELFHWRTAEPFQTGLLLEQRDKWEAEPDASYQKAAGRQRDEDELTSSAVDVAARLGWHPQPQEHAGTQGWHRARRALLHPPEDSSSGRERTLQNLQPRACSEPHFKWPDAPSQQEMAYFQSIPQLQVKSKIVNWNKQNSATKQAAWIFFFFSPPSLFCFKSGLMHG